MGNKLFGVDIAKLVNQNMASGLLPAVLTKVTRGDRTSGSLTSGPEITTETYTARGFVEDYRDADIDGTSIKKGDRKILLLGDSIASGAVPEPGDSIYIEGRTYGIIGPVKRDPAAATYVCQGR